MKITEIKNDNIELKVPKFKCDDCLTKREITPYPNRNGFFTGASFLDSKTGKSKNSSFVNFVLL